MRETSHENLARFIGASVDGPIAILTEFCSKGSLKDLLLKSSLNLDWIFRYSLINDVISGMLYLHNSEHVFHGRLKSSNCLVDSRFCVKLTDFGLRNLKTAASNGMMDNEVITTANLLNIDYDNHIDHDQDQVEHYDSSSILYIAPELYCNYNAFKCNDIKRCKQCNDKFNFIGGQKSDVYRYVYYFIN